MAEIICSEPELGAPEGNFEGYTEGKSESGQTIYYKADSRDSEGTAKEPDMKIMASGKSFHNVSCYWPVGPDDDSDDSDGIDTPADFAAKTSIIRYKLTHSFGVTYKLQFYCKDTYDFRFHSAADTYPCDTYVTGWHTLFMTTYKPAIIGVSGS